MLEIDLSAVHRRLPDPDPVCADSTTHDANRRLARIGIHPVVSARIDSPSATPLTCGTAPAATVAPAVSWKGARS